MAATVADVRQVKGAKKAVWGQTTSTAIAQIAIGGRQSAIVDVAGIVAGNNFSITPTGDLGVGVNFSHAYISANGKITMWFSNTGLLISALPAMTWNYIYWV